MKKRENKKKEKEKRVKKKKEKERERESNKVPYSRKHKLDENLVGVILFCANIVAHHLMKSN